MTTTTQDDFLGQCVVELGGLMLDGSDSWFPLRVRAPFQFTPLSLPPSLSQGPSPWIAPYRPNLVVATTHLHGLAN
jgi:hypothetical protein